jgi:hypothetical protein
MDSGLPTDGAFGPVATVAIYASTQMNCTRREFEGFWNHSYQSISCERQTQLLSVKNLEHLLVPLPKWAQ